MTVCYIGLGSNLGDREGNIREALRQLRANRNIRVLKASKNYETEPRGGPAQGMFINACAKIATSLKPGELLGVLKTIEKSMGRKRTVRFGPRPIDLDILLFGKARVDQRDLKIPHPRMMERDFVLVPLREIAPGLSLWK